MRPWRDYLCGEGMVKGEGQGMCDRAGREGVIRRGWTPILYKVSGGCTPMDRRDFILTGSATLASLLALADSRAFAQAAKEKVSPGHSSSHLPLLFGTDYYPDQTPENL